METGRTRITWIRRSRETPAWSAAGGPRITDRDLVAAVVAAEQLMAAQIHRFKTVAAAMMARDR